MQFHTYGDIRHRKNLLLHGMALTKKEAHFYHENGIPALALALFKTRQPPALDRRMKSLLLYLVPTEPLDRYYTSVDSRFHPLQEEV